MRLDLDRPYQFAKRLQRRFYEADYRDAELQRGWTHRDPSAPFAEEVFGVRPSPERVRSMLVFKPDEIGDAVYALPAAAELKRRYPGARLFLLCQSLTRPLYERAGIFDEIVAIDPKTTLRRPRFSVRRALAEFSVDSFDVSIFLRTYPSYFRQFRRIPARVRVHPIDPLMRSDSVHRAHVSLRESQRLHQSLQLLQIVGGITGRSYGFDDVVPPRFEWRPEDRLARELAFGGRVPERFVVVHPFAKHETRQYPLDYWIRLISSLRERMDVEWALVGGPGDPLLEGLPGVVQTQGRLSLAQSGFLISQASAFAGVLSGPAHWSAALGTPTLTIMSGHSLPAEWAPLGDSLVVRADVPCAPCHQPTCPVYGLACLTELGPERIGPRVEEFLTSALERPKEIVGGRPA